jgi:hypothetical protein
VLLGAEGASDLCPRSSNARSNLSLLCPLDIRILDLHLGNTKFAQLQAIAASSGSAKYDLSNPNLNWPPLRTRSKRLSSRKEDGEN